MDTLLDAAVLAWVGAFVLVAAWAGYRLWQAVMHEERPVLMHRVFEREGLSLAGTRDTLQLQQGAMAIGRCVACRERDAASPG